MHTIEPTTVVIESVLVSAALYDFSKLKNFFHFHPASTLTHYMETLVRIVDSLWHKELERQTDRRPQPQPEGGGGNSC